MPNRPEIFGFDRQTAEKLKGLAGTRSLSSSGVPGSRANAPFLGFNNAGCWMMEATETIAAMSGTTPGTGEAKLLTLDGSGDLVDHTPGSSTVTATVHNKSGDAYSSGDQFLVARSMDGYLWIVEGGAGGSVSNQYEEFKVTKLVTAPSTELTFDTLNEGPSSSAAADVCYFDAANQRFNVLNISSTPQILEIDVLVHFVPLQDPPTSTPPDPWQTEIEIHGGESKNDINGASRVKSYLMFHSENEWIDRPAGGVESGRLSLRQIARFRTGYESFDVRFNTSVSSGTAYATVLVRRIS